MTGGGSISLRRHTRQRQLVLAEVQSRCDHPSADQIYLAVRAEDERISRGTVYRNLKLLAQKGEILQVKVPGVDRFDSRLDYHYHILCTGCGRVSDVALPYHQELDRELERELGYAVQRHRTVFEGVCPDCRRGDGGGQGCGIRAARR